MSDSKDTTPVEYREVIAYEGIKVGSDGSVWSCLVQFRRFSRRGGFGVCRGEWHRLAVHPDRKGYMVVKIKRNRRVKGEKVHRLVLEAFVGPRPPGMECRHLDGNKANNSLANLCWGTSKENTADSRRHGTISHKSVNRGEAHGKAKLTRQGVEEMKRLRTEGMPVRAIAARFGIHWVHAYAVLRGECWSCE
jgi:hypothetical protein